MNNPLSIMRNHIIYFGNSQYQLNDQISDGSNTVHMSYLHLAIVIAIVFYCTLMLIVFVRSTIHTSREFERIIVLRFGRFHRVAGPGVVVTWPIVDKVLNKIDLRTHITRLDNEPLIKRDMTIVEVTAVIFWKVTDPKKAIFTIIDYRDAVTQSIFAVVHAAFNMYAVSPFWYIPNDTINQYIKEDLRFHTENWGITIESVNIQYVNIRRDLGEAVAEELQSI